MRESAARPVAVRRVEGSVSFSQRPTRGGSLPELHALAHAAVCFPLLSPSPLLLLCPTEPHRVYSLCDIEEVSRGDSPPHEPLAPSPTRAHHRVLHFFVRVGLWDYMVQLTVCAEARGRSIANTCTRPSGMEHSPKQSRRPRIPQQCVCRGFCYTVFRFVVITPLLQFDS